METFFLFIVLLVVGLINTISPETAWYLEYGWKFDNATPSDEFLSFSRGIGILFLIICTIMLLWNMGGCVSTGLTEKYFKDNIDKNRVETIILEGKINNNNFSLQLSDAEVGELLETLRYPTFIYESKDDNSGFTTISTYAYLDEYNSLSDTNIVITLKNKEKISLTSDYSVPTKFKVAFTEKNSTFRIETYGLHEVIDDVVKNNYDKLPIEKDNSTNDSTDSTNPEENEEYKNYTGFYGEWKIDWYVTTENSADRELIKAVEDMLFTFHKDILKINEESYDSVTYNLKKATRNSVKIPLSACGINQEEFIEIHVTQNGVDLTIPGSTFYVIDNDNIIIEHKGIYFMALRN